MMELISAMLNRKPGERKRGSTVFGLLMLSAAWVLGILFLFMFIVG